MCISKNIKQKRNPYTNHSNLPIISVSLKIINSSSPSLTFVPPNSGINTLSPTLTDSGISFPLVS